MDIAQYIADLLDEHEEVSIPGIGTFFRKSYGASLDKYTNTFFPPKKELSFKSEEKPASLLIEYISKTKNISLPSAKYFAEKFGETLKSDLNTYGVSDISPLGSLKFNFNEFTFTPSAAYNSNEFFGLFPLKEPAINEATVTIPKNEFIEEQKIKIPTETIITAPEKATSVDEEPLVRVEEAEVRTRRTWPIILVILTALLAIGIAGLLSYPELFNNLTQQATTPAQPKKTPVVAKPVTTIKDSLATADSILSTLESQGFEVEKVPDTITQEITAKTKTIPSKEVITFEIIGASLQTVKEADNYIHNMKAKGIDARIVEAKKGRYIKVSLGSFTDKAKAQNEKRRIQSEINKNAWILEVRNKR
jgi:hypothetical protein